MLKRRQYRHLTVDRQATTDFHTVEQLGPTQHMTPEGFLLCKDVPVARTGVMLYGHGEVPVAPGPDGVARVERGPEELFAPETIASYNGKPVVNEHPDDLVNPVNWAKYSVGITLNPRRGEGEQEDVMLADLLITDLHAIRDVRANKREVSAGYTADYEQTGIGTGRQANIIGNHVALVQRGRCGPRCAIGDQATTEKGTDAMPTPTLRRRESTVKLVRRLFRDAEEDLASALGGSDEGAMDEDDSKPTPADSGGDGHTHIHIHTGAAPAAPADAGAAAPALPGDDKSAAEELGDGMNTPTKDDPVEMRFQALEAAVAKLTSVLQKLVGQEEEEGHEGLEKPAPVGEGDQQKTGDEALGSEDLMSGNDKPTMDSAALQTNFQQLLSDAEVLVPGARLATFDAAKPRKFTIDAMCSMRRQVLGNVAMSAQGSALLASVHDGDLRLATMDCAAVAKLFKDAASAKKAANNAVATADAEKVPAQLKDSAERGHVGKFTSIKELNAFYAAHHGQGK